MESYKLAVKLFVEDASNLKVEAFVPVFHRWIQTKALADHQLIDVADYKHVPEGPGTVLVAHEANIHADLGGNRLGLLYVRKQPIAQARSFAERLRAVFGSALGAPALLEKDESLRGRINFRTDDLQFRIYDRLYAPNTAETFAAIQGDLQSFLQKLYGSTVELTHRPNPESLFEVMIRSAQPVPLSTLLDRVAT